MNVFPMEQIPLLQGLGPEDQMELAACARPLAAPPGAVFFLEGDPAHSLYVIVQGEVDIVKSLGTPDERLLRIEGPGAFVGEMSLFDREGRRTASVRARTQVSLAEITHEAFEGVLQRRPQLAYEILRTLSLRLREADNAAIRDLQQKNRELAAAYEALKAAQAQVVEKEKLEHELQVARDIQRRILPDRVPELPGYEFGAIMEPARFVAGDLYDFFQLEDGKVGVAVGDVAGKGVPAALYMALACSFVRAEACYGRTPTEVLAQVNRHLMAISETSLFVTGIYGILDPKSATFTYGRAGHELPLLLDANGEVQPVGQGVGQPLGILDAPRFDEQVVTIPPGGLLALFSDGITEAEAKDGAFFEVSGLIAALGAHRQEPVQALCERVLEALHVHLGGGHHHDDLTLVMIRARP